MPTDRWQRLERLFADAVELPAGQRSEFLDRACGSEADLRAELASLLGAVEDSGDFLSAPALELFARQILQEGWSVRPGDRIGSYTVERRLGAGGMGEVWRARDDRLGRNVAIKLLLPHPESTGERVLALGREARAAGTLNHTNVLTVYDIGDHGGAPYLVTECLEGESLRARLAVGGALTLDAALDIGRQVARGLGAAHERGIVHRDLKPENVFLGLDGRVKILDFGLAISAQESAAASPPSLLVGTAGYMAPEQVRRQPVDPRADLFALGAVLHEMLTGQRAFKAGSTLETLEAVLTSEPPDLAEAAPEIPTALSHLVHRCLAKSPDDRFATAGEVESALDEIIRARQLPAAPGLAAVLRRPPVMATVLLLLLAMAAGGWRWRVVASRVHWARAIAAPEVQRLSDRGDDVEAFLLARQALDLVPDDPHLNQLLLDVSNVARWTTDPPGAGVALAPYRSPATRWFPLGRTPLEGVRIPRGLFRLRVTKAGFEPIEGTGAPGALPRYRLDPTSTVPSGMVRVVRGRDPVRFGALGELQDYWIDRFEVTNRQFKEFVDRGGYRRPEFWRQPFTEGERELSWEQAMARFRDSSGAPGPATWTSGTYADGQANFPVGGVSWYEAEAYAAFAGKSLPTMYHWYRAAALGRFSDILTTSNFDGRGPAPVGSHHGLGPFGTYDMAGNVKEWCSTATNQGRFLLGGAWNEPRYLFADYDAKGPFERAPEYGFRLAMYPTALPPEVTAPVRIEALGRDPRGQEPVGDEVFAAYRRQVAYDRTPLNAVVESIEEAEIWWKHSVVIDAAYGGERLRLLLFLPKNASPPYQAVAFFPGADAFNLRTHRDMSLTTADLIVRSGRAFLYPIYKGTYERTLPTDTGPVAERELQIAWSRDLGRALDYLETRSDIDRARFAFYGTSAGADAGVFLTALESRLKVSVLQSSGLWTAAREAPESDPVNYAPRIRLPTLLLNGRYDFEIPFETAQRPLFDLLGTPAEHKRHMVFATGHALPVDAVADEVRDWLDRCLGKVDD